MSEFKQLFTNIIDVNPIISIAGLSDDYMISFVGMADISEGGRLIKKHDKYLRDVKFGFTRFIEGDILFAKITPCMENGKGAIATSLRNKLGFGSTEFHVIRNNKNGDSNFIFQILQSRELRLKAEANMTGSAGQKRVPSDFFNFYRTFIPPFPEQRKIANILSTVDKVIEKTEDAIAKYKAIKQGMMHDLFTRGLDENGKLRPRHEDAPDRYKPTELGWLPKEWDLVTLDKITDCIGDGIHATPQYVNTSDYFFINGNNLNNGNIIFNGKTNCVSAEEYKKYYIKLTKNTILLSINGTIGNKAYYNDEKIILGKSVAYICCNAITCTNYIYYLFSSWAIRHYFENELTGSTIKNLSLYSIRNAPIPLPEYKEQVAISEKISSVEQIIERNINLLGKQNNLKKALMTELLTGRVRVKVGKK